MANHRSLGVGDRAGHVEGRRQSHPHVSGPLRRARRRAGGDADAEADGAAARRHQTTTQIAAVYAKIQEAHGGLDFVVHGAAFASREEITGRFLNTSREGFKQALDISAYSLIALARGAQPLMVARGGGSVLTLTFLGSDRVFPNYNVMGVAKAALESSVRYLAADLGPENIRVNAISAGPVKTLAAAGIGGFSTILGVVREKAPLRRAIETSEVGDAAAFLLSDAGRGVTGEVLMVDAGFHVLGM